MTNIVALFDTPDDFMVAIFGPRQHDAHVKTRTESIWLTARQDFNRDADLRVRAELARMSEERAQEIAKTHGYDTAALGFQFRRWDTGCFSQDMCAASQRKLYRRALDIALERRAFAEAAE